MKKSPLNRKSKHKSLRQKLYIKAEKVFHAWIRKRDEKKGCITCKGKVEQAGHFKHNKLDFDEMNLNGQCISCNYYRSGAGSSYGIRLVEIHGLEKVKELERQAEIIKKYSIEELREIIKKYEL